MQAFQTHAVPEQSGVEKGEREQAEHESLEHVRRHIERPLGGRVAAADHDGMDRAEQADREEGQGDAQETDDGIDGAEASPSIGILDALAQSM